MNMIILGKQKKERFLLSQLKNKHRLQLLLKKRVVFHQRRKLELLDEETEKRIGEALAEIKAGDYITINPGDDILYALNNFDDLLKIQKAKREQDAKVST